MLWLWCRLAAIAPIRPLAWEPPHAVGVALKRKRKKKRIQVQQLRWLWDRVQSLIWHSGLKGSSVAAAAAQFAAVAPRELPDVADVAIKKKKSKVRYHFK